MGDTRHPVPAEDVGTLSTGPLDLSPPLGRWCPYCGANLTGIPVREGQHEEEALFAATGRRLKVALSVGFVLVWLVLSVLDWLSEPAALSIPGWFSALGALMLFYLLGFSPLGLLRRRG